MKIVRFLPLALVAAALTACGADRLTGPEAPRVQAETQPRAELAGNGGFGSGN
jgi:hypothetical protein